MILRKFQFSDLEEIASLESRAFDVGPYDVRELQAIFEMEGSFNYVAVDTESGRISGYVVACGISDSVCDVESIAVDPDFQGKGVGRDLLFAIEREMAARGFAVSVLEVREKNDKAISFYSKNGYSLAESVVNYYREHLKGSRNALRMTKRL
ncbi:MAG: GNAT family N-acetyltransferase [Candidatus Thermoplasmatota archaeon]|nr:GNAT family N-acetyltransferase [Candidatus Thermoplasmatota archaeon]MCL5800777.1 GNAT family N-acetyltransferase [Candidatus Thermoplasmatota archaeon]